MPNMDHQPGLLGHSLATSDGTHMYHAGKPAKIAYTHPQEQALLDEGYGYEYIPQEYPKALALEARAGEFRQITVNNAEEENALRGRGRVLQSNHPDLIDGNPQSTAQIIHEATGVSPAPFSFSPVIPPAPIERLADPTVVGPLADAKEHNDPVPVALKAPVEEDTN